MIYPLNDPKGCPQKSCFILSLINRMNAGIEGRMPLFSSVRSAGRGEVISRGKVVYGLFIFLVYIITR